jgi:hypothetical protein
MGNTVPELGEATTVGFASQSSVAPISKATKNFIIFEGIGDSRDNNWC